MDDINDAFVRDTNFSLPGLAEGRQFETNNNNSNLRVLFQPHCQIIRASFIKLHLLPCESEH